MNASASCFFNTTISGQPASSLAPFIAPVKTAAKSIARQAPKMSASLWRHSLAENEAASRHGVLTRSLGGLLEVLSLGSVAVAAWQTHALLSGNRLHEAISTFLR